MEVQDGTLVLSVLIGAACVLLLPEADTLDDDRTVDKRLLLIGRPASAAIAYATIGVAATFALVALAQWLAAARPPPATGKQKRKASAKAKLKETMEAASDDTSVDWVLNAAGAWTTLFLFLMAESWLMGTQMESIDAALPTAAWAALAATLVTCTLSHATGPRPRRWGAALLRVLDGPSGKELTTSAAAGTAATPSGDVTTSSARGVVRALALLAGPAVAALAVPLDWEVAWQRWPACGVYGLFAAAVLVGVALPCGVAVTRRWS